MLGYKDHSLCVSPNRRAGIVLCLLTAAVLSGCGGGMTPEQKQAISKLQGIGGRINFKGSGCKVDMTKTPVEDKDLVHLRNVPHLVSLDLEGTRITDAGLEHLRAIESLEFVSLQRATVTREGVEQLRKAMPKTEVRY
jgi:hypothetical protein